MFKSKILTGNHTPLQASPSLYPYNLPPIFHKYHFVKLFTKDSTAPSARVVVIML